MTTSMHAHLTAFLTGYVATLGRDAAPPVADRLEDMARRLPEWDDDAVECLWRDIALWFDGGLDERDVAERLAGAPVAVPA